MSDGRDVAADADDAALVAACQSRRPAANRAFTLLVRRYEARVYRTCLRMLRNEADAEDVVQDVFVKVFRKLNDFEGRSSFSTWVFAITRNECLSAITRRRPQGARPPDDEDEQSIPDPEPAVADAVESADLLEQTLARLKPEDREVLVARFVSDLRIEEVADVLELSLSAAKMRLYRAMERFRTIAEEISVAPEQEE